jgi:hypothetical protein
LTNAFVAAAKEQGGQRRYGANPNADCVQRRFAHGSAFTLIGVCKFCELGAACQWGAVRRASCVRAR